MGAVFFALLIHGLSAPHMSAAATIRIGSDPPGKRIHYSLNGGNFTPTTLTTPQSFPGLPAGDYLIRLQDEPLGWLLWASGDTTVTAAAAADLFADLRPGTIVLWSNLKRANLRYRYKGVLVRPGDVLNWTAWSPTVPIIFSGSSPPYNLSVPGLPPGNYEAELNAVGYEKKISGPRYLPPGGDVAIDLSLARLSGALRASPNPCTIPAGRSICSTTVTWEAPNAPDDPSPCIFVKETGRLFACGRVGSQVADWIIDTGFTFELRAANSLSAPLMASLTVGAGGEVRVPPPAPAPGTGNLAVASRPEGTVILYAKDGGAWTEHARPTNAILRDLEPGTYRVRLRTAALEVWQSAPVTVSAGRTATLPAPDIRGGDVTLMTNRPEVYIDFKYRGLGPGQTFPESWSEAVEPTVLTHREGDPADSYRLEIPGIPPGTYLVRLRAEGYAANIGEATFLAPGSTARVEVPLNPMPPVVTSLTLAPTSAEVGRIVSMAARGLHFSRDTRFVTRDRLGRIVAVFSSGDPGFDYRGDTEVRISTTFYVPYGEYFLTAERSGSGRSERQAFRLASPASLSLRRLACTAAARCRFRDGEDLEHAVEVYAVKNPRDGTDYHFALALPHGSKGPGPYPVIVYARPYGRFPFPPSPEPVDRAWADSPGGYVEDGSFPLPDGFEARYERCKDPRPPGISGRTGESVPCRIFVPQENSLTAYFSEASYEWALRNGYAVALPFGRFYAGMDLLSSPYGIIAVVDALKSMGGKVDAGRVGLMGGSLGAYEVIYSLSRRDRPQSIAAAVTMAGPVDIKRMHEYIFGDTPGFSLARLIAPGMTYDHDRNETTASVLRLVEKRNFYVPYINRFFKGLGSDLGHPAWEAATRGYVVDHLSADTPLLLISSTDDYLVPVSETLGLHAALAARQKPVSVWVYEHGPPLWNGDAGTYNRLIAQSHGLLDEDANPSDVEGREQNHVRWGALTRNFFVQMMPPDNATVRYEHFSRQERPNEKPTDERFDVTAAFSYFRRRVCERSAQRGNISGLMRGYAHPRFYYASDDPRLPAGPGPDFIARVVNQVWRAEGLSWSAENVVENLETGRLPETCRTTYPPVEPPIEPPAPPIEPPAPPIEPPAPPIEPPAPPNEPPAPPIEPPAPPNEPPAPPNEPPAPPIEPPAPPNEPPAPPIESPAPPIEPPVPPIEPPVPPIEPPVPPIEPPAPPIEPPAPPIEPPAPPIEPPAPPIEPPAPPIEPPAPPIYLLKPLDNAVFVPSASTTGGWRGDRGRRSHRIPSRMRAGYEHILALAFRNIGLNVWQGEQYYLAGAERGPWSERRVPLPAGVNVLPGETVVFIVPVRAPQEAGRYRMRWRMGRSGFGFGESSPGVDVEAVSERPVSDPDLRRVALSRGAGEGRDSRLILEGRNFLPGATVLYVGPVSGEVEAQVVNSRTILADFAPVRVPVAAAALPGRYRFVVQNPDGGQSASTLLEVARDAGPPPDGLRLSEVYAFPNPAVRARRANIHLISDKALDRLEVRIYDLTGRPVHQGDRSAPTAKVGGKGFEYEYRWEDAGAASGVYLYVVEASAQGGGEAKVDGKFVLVR